MTSTRFPSASALLSETAHRPWSLPKRPCLLGQQSWVMVQSWQQLLFAHWRVKAETLRPLIPAGLEIDTFGGDAWIGVVPFTMNNVHPRGTFNVPGLSKFPEMNVRTYVTRDGKPGVWFFSLDADNRIAVWGARRFFHLPYFKAAMQSRRERGSREGDGVCYASRRTDTRSSDAEFETRYRPTSPIFHAERGTLDHWLTERYCLYCADSGGRLYRGEIHHPPWALQYAEAEITVNTMGRAQGIVLPDAPPLLHYSEQQDMLTWYLERLDG